MALTATATVATRRKIISSLNMRGCCVVSRNPYKSNIFYSVQKKTTIEECFLPIVQEVASKVITAERTIIFCRSLKDCFSIYQYFRMQLKQGMYYPKGSPSLSKYRLVDMFTGITEDAVKTTIIENFTSAEGCCRVVIGTIAFGMGLNSPNVRNVIHWGPSSDIESYVQESGRVGRDGEASFATLYYADTDFSGGGISSDMKKYCRHSSGCRKQFLFKHFDGASGDVIDNDYVCCDICDNIEMCH